MACKLQGRGFCAVGTVCSAYCMRTQGDFSDMFVKLLADKDAREEWKVYSVVDGQFPTQEELSTVSSNLLAGVCSVPRPLIA